MNNLYQSKMNKTEESSTFVWCPCKGGCTGLCKGKCTGSCSGSCAGNCSGSSYERGWE